MTESQIQAARALVASPHFRWMPAMRGSWKGLDGYSFRVVRVQGSVVQCYDETSWSWENADTNIKPDDLPDLNDPATLGCLLALAREAWKNNGSATETTVGWRYYSTGGTIRGQGPSEGEALVAAILAAPVKP